MADPNQPTQDTSALATLLGQQNQPKLGDILGLLQEMRARRQAESQQSASPLAQLLSGLIRAPQEAAGNSLQSYLGAKLAAMDNDRISRQWISDLGNGRLGFNLGQLSNPAPQAGNFMDDLQSLGISPEDFRGMLGLKPNTPPAAAPMPQNQQAPMSGPGTNGLAPQGASAAFAHIDQVAPQLRQQAFQNAPLPTQPMQPDMILQQILQGALNHSASSFQPSYR